MNGPTGITAAMLLAACLCASAAGAASSAETAQPDTTSSSRHNAEKSAAQPDTTETGGWSSIDSLEARMEKNRVGKLIAEHLFTTRSIASGDTNERSESPYLPMEGKFIRKIEIYRLNIFNDTQAGSKNPEVPWMIHAAERIHVDTWIRRIKNFMLFDEGDPVDPLNIADSERLLRALELFFRMMPATPHASGAGARADWGIARD